MMLRFKYFVFVILTISCFNSYAGVIGTLSVDVRNYITQNTPGFHLCSKTEVTSNGSPLCLDGRWVTSGNLKEFFYSYTNGIVDYITRDSQQPFSIGVVRNRAEPALNNIYRCFSNPGQYCTVPSNAAYPPESLPMIFEAQIVTPQDVQAAENSGGVPIKTIYGAISFYGWQVFGVNQITNLSTCAQQSLGNVTKLTLAVVASSIDFGGDIGIKSNVLIVDEIQDGGGTSHIERYYYVQGYGRVRENSSFDNNLDGIFGDSPTVNSVRNSVVSGDIDTSGGVYCFQGGGAW